MVKWGLVLILSSLADMLVAFVRSFRTRIRADASQFPGGIFFLDPQVIDLEAPAKSSHFLFGFSPVLRWST